MYFGIPAANALDELRSFFNPATIFGNMIDGPNWSAPSHIFEEVTAVGMGRTESEQKYSYKTDFVTRREIQRFGG